MIRNISKVLQQSRSQKTLMGSKLLWSLKESDNSKLPINKESDNPILLMLKKLKKNLRLKK
jgi:hypothetical protein